MGDFRPWDGLRYDISDVADEGLYTAQNVSYKILGELRRRPGLYEKVNRSGVLVTEYQDAFGTVYLLYKDSSGNLVAQNVAANSGTLMAAGLSTNRGCFARSNGRVYYCDDFDTMKVIESPLLTGCYADAGIVAPAYTGMTTTGVVVAATGVALTSGTHGFRYRYFNSKTLYMSDPSIQVDFIVGTGSQLTFDIVTGGTVSNQLVRSTNAKVDQIICELTDAGSSTFYRAATVNQALTGVVIGIGDIELRMQVTASRDGDWNHQPPPLFKYVCEHRGRLFGIGTDTWTGAGIAISESGTTLAFTGAAFSTGFVGRLARINSGSVFYRISAATTTGFTISQNFTGTTLATGSVTVLSAQPDMLFWTSARFPESWNPINFARRVLQGNNDTPTGIYSMHDILFLFGFRTMRQFDYSGDPASAQIITLPGEMGLWNQRCLCEVWGRLFGWGKSGAWVLSGLIPQHISRPVDILVDADYDIAYSEKFHGSFDPVERTISWFYVKTGDTVCKNAMVYDIDRQKWSTRTYVQGIDASTVSAGGATNRTRMLLADNNGYSWYPKADTFDMLPPTFSGNGVVTVTSGAVATATGFTVSETLPTGSGDVSDIYLQDSTGSVAQIYSNTSGAIVLNSALGAAPAVGASLYMGVIDSKIRSKWLVGDGINTKKRYAYLHVKKVPGTLVGPLICRIYRDFLTTPVARTTNYYDAQNKGVTWTNGATFCTLDLDTDPDGHVHVPLCFEWSTALSWEIESVVPKDIMKLLSVELDFHNKEAKKQVEVPD